MESHNYMEDIVERAAKELLREHTDVCKCEITGKGSYIYKY